MQFSDLILVVQELDDVLRRRAAQAVNVALTARNWLVGAWIVEFEQNGEDRAKYGERLIQEIAQATSVKGLSVSNLRSCRQFYSNYPRIGQALSDQFGDDLGIDISLLAADKRIHQSLTGELRENLEVVSNSQLSDSEFAVDPTRILTQLSFTHIVRKHLMAVDDNPPVGLLLCTGRDDALVEYALGGMDQQVFVSKYQLQLPDAEEIRAFVRKDYEKLAGPLDSEG